MTRVLLNIPCYHSVIPGTLRAVLEASTGKGISLDVKILDGSLLAKNFNRAWATGLNARKESASGPLYFVMLHADIITEAFWLDKLIGEYRRADLDVLSAIVPIKDFRGLTTTGYAEPGQTSVTRFTVNEVAELPETFTAADCPSGKALMVNSGLWIADLRKPWISEAWPLHFNGNKFKTFPCFSIMDWIRQEENGDYVDCCVSEDWLWSHWLHEHGVKVGATRVIKLWHRGSWDFPAHDPHWGQWKTDKGDHPQNSC